MQWLGHGGLAPSTVRGAAPGDPQAGPSWKQPSVPPGLGFDQSQAQVAAPIMGTTLLFTQQDFAQALQSSPARTYQQPPNPTYEGMQPPPATPATSAMQYEPEFYVPSVPTTEYTVPGTPPVRYTVHTMQVRYPPPSAPRAPSVAPRLFSAQKRAPHVPYCPPGAPYPQNRPPGDPGRLRCHVRHNPRHHVCRIRNHLPIRLRQWSLQLPRRPVQFSYTVVVSKTHRPCRG